MAKKFNLFHALRVFAILSSAAIGAGQELAKAKQDDSPGGPEVTEAERKKILVAGLQAGAKKVKDNMGIDLFPVFRAVIKAGPLADVVEEPVEEEAA